MDDEVCYVCFGFLCIWKCEWVCDCVYDIVFVDGTYDVSKGGVAQLVERVLSMHEVRGSIPLSSTMCFATTHLPAAFETFALYIIINYTMLYS